MLGIALTYLGFLLWHCFYLMQIYQVAAHSLKKKKNVFYNQECCVKLETILPCADSCF